MPDLSSVLGTFFDFLQVVIGFSLIIIIHELGHFLAARWAGVRVLAFAVGFGPAVLSYRKGLGFRRGSSEQDDAARGKPGVSATEYRLNWLPLGGYVKMLGQDDADPTATSDEPDSYQNCAVWKRMIIISAGVVFNLITAALLFIIVFMAGLPTPPPRIGMVDPNSPAAQAVALNAEEAGVVEPGLQPGDLVLRVNDTRAEEFTDIVVGAAMAAPNKPVHIEVQRGGASEPLRFSIVPRREEGTGMLGIGVGQPWSTRIAEGRTDQERAAVQRRIDDAGLPEVQPGMTLVSVNGREATTSFDIERALEQSGGQPIPVVFEAAGGKTVETILRPRPELQTAILANGEWVTHLLGLPTLMRVSAVMSDSAAKAGLQEGDVFTRIGALEWPARAAAVPEIRRHAGKPVAAEVLRRSEDGLWMRVPLELPVSSAGTIGFEMTDSSAATSHVATWPDATLAEKQPSWQTLRPALELGDLRGRRVLAVNGRRVGTLLELREVLKEQTREALEAGGESVTLSVLLERPAHPDRTEVELPWTLDRAAIELLHDESKLGWTTPLVDVLAPDEILLKAGSPGGAVAMGLRRTHRVMTMTYLTFLRLFQGSVKVEHLKGPVGIAHVGTVIADRGFVWLLFFMALISVNLAVINFLPIPIADGGHFVFLVYEQITGRPPPLAVQNAAAIAGLVLIASVFLVVTFNDIRNLF